MTGTGQLPGDAAPDPSGPDDAHLHLTRLLALRDSVPRGHANTAAGGLELPTLGAYWLA